MKARLRVMAGQTSRGFLVVVILLGSLRAFGQTESGVRTTPEEEVFHQAVSWAPDGSQLAISEYRGRGKFSLDNWAILVVSMDGSARRKLVDRGIFVSWSPDGKRLVFDSTRDGNSEIYSVGLDGTDLRRLTDDPASDAQPAWSPDGRSIAFCSDRVGKRDIYVMSVDGGGVRRLTNSDAADHNPAWSP